MLSQMQVLIGDLDGGMQYAMKSLAIISPMARAEPENIEVLDKLQDVYELIGDMQGGNGLSANLGDTAGALENHRKAMEIAQKAVKLKPDDPAVRRSVAVYDIKIADDLAKQGDRNGALKSYREAMDIYQAISVGSLSTVYTREINLVYTRIGDTQLMEGDSRGALKSYRAAMDLAENLASADPQNALAREDLATGYAMLGKASGDSGKVKDGRAERQCDGALQGMRGAQVQRGVTARAVPRFQRLHPPTGMATSQTARRRGCWKSRCWRRRARR